MASLNTSTLLGLLDPENEGTKSFKILLTLYQPIWHNCPEDLYLLDGHKLIKTVD
jgi:hypothetical protein